MRICILGSVNSIHVQRWALALKDNGHEIKIVSLYNGNINGIESVVLPRTRKIFYLKYYQKIKRIIDDYKPDIVHAHHASSYGFLGALSKFHPYIISVWGYDVLLFPDKSPIHKRIIRYSLKKADLITATSKALADNAKRLCDAEPEIIPFGVDCKRFDIERDYNKTDLTIGIIKDLRPVYGISDLIKAFALLVRKYQEVKLKIVGEGHLKQELDILCENLKIKRSVDIIPRVGHDKVVEILGSFDIFAMPSHSEGFGVVAVEAMAAGLPVVASRVGGVPEIIDEGINGLLIQPGDIDGLSKALETYIVKPELRESHGRAGKEKVKREYDWNVNVAQMERLYERVLHEKSS